MKQTIVGVFEQRTVAIETSHVLLKAGFIADCLPRPRPRGSVARNGLLARAAWRRRCVRWRQRWLAFMDADLGLSAFSGALKRGASVVKVYAETDDEGSAAKRILRTAGALEIDVLADEWIEPQR